MKIGTLILLLLFSHTIFAQSTLQEPFVSCQVQGSTTIYDYLNKKWFMSDSLDANRRSLPASTFKVINLLIALETKVIKDENEIVKWPGKTDTVRYGYRPDIYHDMSVKEAFKVSAGWVFIELAKRIGREKYSYYLKACNYSNLDLSEKDTDFWNIGSMGISPVEQVNLLIKIFDNELPFSKRHLDILKQVMITEEREGDIMRSKTGWTKWEGKDIGWWVGYVSRGKHMYFFATRITKDRSLKTDSFGECRKKITWHFLKKLDTANGSKFTIL